MWNLVTNTSGILGRVQISFPLKGLSVFVCASTNVENPSADMILGSDYTQSSRKKTSRTSLILFPKYSLGPAFIEILALSFLLPVGSIFICFRFYFLLSSSLKA